MDMSLEYCYLNKNIFQVFWNISGPMDQTADFQPQNGSVVIGDGIRDSSIVIQVLPDNVAELTERFMLNLVSVSGGAEINPAKNVSLFSIRFVHRLLH